MTPFAHLQRHVPWPRTLRMRLFLILLAGLSCAHLMSFADLVLERNATTEPSMLAALETDVETSIAILDRLPAGERAEWLPLLNREMYRYLLGPGLPGVVDETSLGGRIAETIRKGAGDRFPVKVEAIEGDRQRLQAHLLLSDGEPLTIDVTPAIKPIALWLPNVMLLQMLFLALCCWFAVRRAIEPLVNLAEAGAALDPIKNAPRLKESGPMEVACAASALNSMRDRIAHYLEERVQILAAISHDLQTPITRIKLRVEMADESPERDKILQDLMEIERLVHEGIAYARSPHGNAEKSSRIDIGSFLESLVFDYQDTGKRVTISSRIDATMITRPCALRRILTNLIDNALKFAGHAEVCVGKISNETIMIRVLDRGPGIPAHQLKAVLQPFFRLEHSRNRETGGTGLGLAIAHQLTQAIGGSLDLRNREHGGILAEVTLSGIAIQIGSSDVMAA